MKENIVIATIKSWNKNNAEKLKAEFNEYNIIIVTEKDKLSFEYLNEIKPAFVFFPHWSWLIPKEIYEKFNCIVFHMTDLPYGRGGSPLQNLIINKQYKTKISAIEVQEELDSGRIFCKEAINIEEGNADQILKKVSDKIFRQMIPFIVHNRPAPTPQEGKIVSFKRRSPSQSNIANAPIENIKDFYDFIRMLDGEGYPKSFLITKEHKITFSDAEIVNNSIQGKFEISKYGE